MKRLSLKVSLILFTLLFIFSQSALFAEDHDHDEKHDHKQHSDKNSHDSDHKENHHKTHKDNHDEDNHEHDEHSDGHSKDSHDTHGEGEGHDEHESSKFGPGKAILEVKNEGQNFKLAMAAEQVMGIKSQLPVLTEEPHHFKVPRNSIVEYQEKIGLFRKRDGWYELIDARIIKTVNGESLVYSENLSVHDQIIYSGVGLLRVAHLEASGQGGKGHAH